MRNIICIFFLVFATTFATAQNKAKQLADEVTQKIRSYKTISVDFDYNAGGNKQSGSLDIQGDKYFIKMMGITQIYDGKKSYTINPEDEEVTVAKLSANSGAITPSSALSFFTKGYSYELGEKKNIGGKSIQYLVLKPTDSKSKNKEVLLGIDTATKHIYNIIETLPNGKKSTITIQNFKVNPTFNSSHFVFNSSKYSNYYINNID